MIEKFMQRNGEKRFFMKLFVVSVFCLIFCKLTVAQGIGSYDVNSLNKSIDIESMLYELDAININKKDLLDGKHNHALKLLK